jgi:hypothetical protein
VFPVRYELSLHILFRINPIFKGLKKDVASIATDTLPR